MRTGRGLGQVGSTVPHQVLELPRTDTQLHPSPHLPFTLPDET